jgi:hypothetical protein
MELNIGSNIYRNANGVLTLDGKEQIVIEARGESPQLLVTADFYDAKGTHVAHLRRNVWAFNFKTRFELETSPTLSLFSYPTGLKIVDKETGQTILDITLVKEAMVHIASGRLYTHKGQLLDITPHCWRFPAYPAMFGSVQDIRGGAVVIS